MPSYGRLATATAALLVVLTASPGLSPAAATDSAQRNAWHPIPNCTQLTDHAGPQVWTSPGANLIRKTDELICSAAMFSTVDIKMWFVHAPGGAMRRLLDDVALMAKWHHVRFNVITGAPSIHGVHQIKEPDTYGPAARWLHVYSCFSGCRSQIPPSPQHLNGSISHSKWITVSRTIYGKPAMMETSANLTSYETTVMQDSALYFYGNTALQSAFDARWRSLLACANGDCARDRSDPVVESNKVDYDRGGTIWRGAGHQTSVYFAPVLVDPLLAELRKVRCPATISILNPSLGDPPIIAQLEALKARGCRVQILTQERPTYPATVLDDLAPRCLTTEHDKVTTISTNHETLAGSSDIWTGAWSQNDNQTVRMYSRSVYDQYVHRFDQTRAGATTCVATPGAGGSGS